MEHLSTKNLIAIYIYNHKLKRDINAINHCNKYFDQKTFREENIISRISSIWYISTKTDIRNLL